MNAMQRMTKARTMMVMDQPFFATLALYLELVMTSTQVEALGTDGVRMFVNPKWVEDKTDLQLQFGWAHEVEHLARRHHTRRAGRDFKKWNVATDYGINGDLVRAGFVPPDILIDAKYDGLSAEQIYRMREDEEAAQKKQEEQSNEQKGDKDEDGDESDQSSDDQEDNADADADDQGEGDDGEGDDGDSDEGDGDSGEGEGDDQSDDASSGEGDGGDENGDDADGDSPGNGNGTGNAGEGEDKPVPSFGNCGAILDAAESPAEIATIEAEWEARVRQAINVAIKQAGSVPGYLQRIIDELNAPRVDWKDVLRRFIDSRSRTDSTWSRPNRRMIHSGIVLPSMIVDGINHLGIVIDTSGSISDSILTAFAAELQAAVDEGACDRVTVVYCDARVQGVEQFQNGDEIKLNAPGGGGTDFAPALAWYVENEPDVSALIYFTDLYGSFGTEPDVPVLWAAYGDPREIARMTVPFGELVQIEC